MRIAANLLNLPRAFFDQENGKDQNSFILSKERSHHLQNVLRLRIGDSCLLIDRKTGTYFEAKITSTAENMVLSKIGSDFSPLPDNRPGLTLLIALCKGDKNERIADWATELGISKILFFAGDHSVVKVKEEKDLEKKTSRFSTVVEAATLQCGRTKIPEVSVFAGLKDCLNTSNIIGDSRLVCSLRPDAQALDTALALQSKEITFAIGPEGDLSDNEEAFLREQEFKPVSLGPQILRSELAVVSAISGIWHVIGNEMPNV